MLDTLLDANDGSRIGIELHVRFYYNSRPRSACRVFPRGAYTFPSLRFSDLSSSSEAFPLSLQRKEAESVAFDAIMAEVDQLNLAGDRIEALAERHPPVSEALITIAGNVRSTATVLALLVETKLWQ